MRRCGAGRAILTLAGALLPALLWSALATQPAAAQTAAADTLVRDLRDLFGRGFLVDDGNGDDVVDIVLGRVLLPAAPHPAEVVAAANLAARLGWETTATDLALVSGDDGRSATPTSPLVMVGRAAPSPTSPVQPGEGVIELLAGGRWAGGAAAVNGGDATGVLAAAAYLSSRYPDIWTVDGPTWADVASRVSARLDAVEATPDSVRVASIIVDAQRPGVSRALLRVFYGDSTARRIGLADLREAAAGRRDVDPTQRAMRDSAADTGAARPELARREPLTFDGLRRLDISVELAGSADTVRVRDGQGRDAQPDPTWPSRESPDFSLSAFYTIEGIYRDTNQDLVPDRTEAFISADGADAAGALADLAARIALETAGARLPLVGLGGQDDAPERHGIPLVFGVDHFHAARLRGTAAWRRAAVARARGSWNSCRAHSVSGMASSSPARTARGSKLPPAGWLRAPPICGRGARARCGWTRSRRESGASSRRGRPPVRPRSPRTSSAPGWTGSTASTSTRSPSRSPRWSHLPDSGSTSRGSCAARSPKRAPPCAPYATGFGVGDTIFTQDIALPWEVDTARATLRTDVLPHVGPSSRGRIEVRVSEPPAVRAELAASIRRELAGRGVPDGAFDVSVLSAYKQGYSWIEDHVLPRLRELPVARIDIAYHTLRDSDEVRWQAIASATRWLQELYPIDAVLARELGIWRTRSSPSRRRQSSSPDLHAARPRRVPVTPDSRADELRSEVRRPPVLRPLSRNTRTCASRPAGFGSTADGDTLVTVNGSARIRGILGCAADGHVPAHHRLRHGCPGRPAVARRTRHTSTSSVIDLELSEPDHRIGVDEEVISSLEALHEDIYFETLTLFDLIGGRWGVGSLDHAGRILPWIRQTRSPGAGTARISVHRQGARRARARAGLP
jgi:hypothetical protein